MIGAQLKSLPTQFAIMIAIHCDLYVPPDEESGNEELWYDLRDRLANFQKMALSTDLETSMIAYFGFDELSDHQKEQLAFIHKNTKAWLFGHVSEQLLIKLESKMTNGKEAKEIAEIIIDTCGDGNPEGKEKLKKSLLVRYANVPEKKLEKSENAD